MNNNDAQDGSDPKNNKRKGWRKKSFETPPDDKNDDNERKKMHRDMEKQRRQEMGRLYGSLRSLLPLEYVKGKRSVSDQMNEAVNYINHLHDNIKELGVKRDEMKRLASSSSRNFGEIGSSYNVTVSPCWGGGGVEIIISSDFIERELQFSRVLHVLLDEGLNVVSCISTKVNEGVTCKIQSEVGDQKPINIPELQRKLNDMLYGP